MALRSLFPLNFIPTSNSNSKLHIQCSLQSSFAHNSPKFSNKKREFPIASVASIPYGPINVDYLEEEFSGHGVTFQGLGDNCIARLELENGSTATMMLPSGLITSYKAQMWHGGTMELLQTSVLEGRNGDAVIQGGVSPAFEFVSESEESWSPNMWAISNISGNSKDYIQIELKSTKSKNMVEARYIMSLNESVLSSELIVTNSSASPIQLTGSLISHLTVSTPEATYAYGLEGSNFFSRPMFLSKYSIVPPNVGRSDFSRFWGDLNLNSPFFSWGSRKKMNHTETQGRQLEGEEDENYKDLAEEMSRIYTSAPQKFTIIDRGRRNSVVIGREGFDELYLFSPGSEHEMYGMYSYICVGQSAMLKPVVLQPGDVWSGAQHLCNPNSE